MNTGYPAARGTCPFDPPPEYEPGSLRQVTLFSGVQAWLVTRYEDARAALRDPALSSSSLRPGFPALGTAVEFAPFNSTFIALDDPAHARIRRMMIADFTPGRALALRPEIQRLADALADRMIATGSPTDFVSSYAQPLSSQTICLILGVPYAEHDSFEHHTFVVTDGTASDEQKHQSSMALLDLLRRLIEARTRAPRDDLISRLIQAGQLTDEELLYNVALVLGAGVDTTANMIALSALAIVRGDVQLADGQVGDAVEELLRYWTIVQLGLARVAVADTEIGGQCVRAGEGVIVSVLAANRDATAFPDPDVLDVRRPMAKRHLAFGYGVHQCLGQSLARTELQVAVSSLAARFPGLRLAGSELRFKDTMDFYGLRELVLAW